MQQAFTASYSSLTTLKMEAVSFFESQVTNYGSNGRHILTVGNLQNVSLFKWACQNMYIISA
jgi:hypothetical protein